MKNFLMLSLILVLMFGFAAACGKSSDGDGDCTGGLVPCDGTCVDTSSDHDNCGGCGNACGDEQVCREGGCACSGEGLSACGRECVNTASDPDNCGSCGTECTGDQVCRGGSCARCADEEIACDNLDDDCDGQIDEGLTRDCTNLCGEGSETCTAGVWGGCTAPTPGTEVCDGEDNDCDGAVDEGVANTYYEDYDGDGFGNIEYSEQACAPFTHPTRNTDYIADNRDCDDRNEDINPDATEACDEVDNDCDDETDEDLPMSTYWPEEPNEDCAHYVMASIPFDEGGTYTMTGYSYHADLTPDIDVVRIELREITDTVGCFNCCGDCGFPFPEEADTCYECMDLVVTLTEPSDLDLEVCLNVTNATAGTCASPIQRICSNDGGATGNTVTLRWEGWCNRDDNMMVYAEIFPRSGTAGSSCHSYELGFEFNGEMPSDSHCGSGYLTY